ncbi:MULTISPECIES: hypothetical protein [unclassified Streptomyces]|uniref:hypothetical protein n=1 Tax=unclassified Streptomyces TaxID=2593676 RepID=UPI002DD81A48|nr:hypothetical protein [Streptomyces sp. NBC_01445]WSE02322.1 hypothetical protein OG574_02315 [Streptomyces sp. NBC_01445]
MPAQATTPIASSASRSRTTTVGVSLLLGLVLGGGGVGVAWSLGDDSSSATAAGSAPAGDVRAACQALDGFDESKYVAKGPDGDIAVNRYAAAGALSASAAAGDAKYKPLAQAIRRSQDRHARVFDFDAKVKKELDEARRICKDL